MPKSGLRATAVVAAAGSGERLGSGGPKAFVELAGRPMLAYSVEALAAVQSIESIVIAAPPGNEDRAAEIGREAAGAGLHVEAVTGAAHRSESVLAGLQRVSSPLVAVQDAARPLVTPALVRGLLAELEANEECGAVVPAAPVTDTIKEVLRDKEVDRTLDRSSLWAAQTPQVFRVEALRDALNSTDLLAQASDDAMLLERIGGNVLLFEAPAENIKVTTPLDLQVAELLLGARS